MRKQASAVLSKARLGQDAVAEKRSAVGKRSALLGDTAQRYLAEREPKLRPRYYLEIKRQLEQDWRPLHAQSVDGLTRHVVVGRVDEIAAGQGEVAADRARMALSGFYGWARCKYSSRLSKPPLGLKSRNKWVRSRLALTCLRFSRSP
jgi:hypothetical protein